MAIGLMKTVQRFEVPVVLEHAPEGVIASCDKLNAVASGATERRSASQLRKSLWGIDGNLREGDETAVGRVVRRIAIKTKEVQDDACHDEMDIVNQHSLAHSVGNRATTCLVLPAYACHKR